MLCTHNLRGKAHSRGQESLEAALLEGQAFPGEPVSCCPGTETVGFDLQSESERVYFSCNFGLWLEAPCCQFYKVLFAASH